MNRFVIPARLPGLNDVIYENRRGWYAGAALKKDTETLIRLAIRSAMRRGECWPVLGPAAILFEWQETNRLRDLDNIFSGKKFILDAMRAEGLIRNDSQKYVRALADVFDVGDRDQVTVIIEILGGQKNGNLDGNAPGAEADHPRGADRARDPHPHGRGGQGRKL